MGGTIMTLTTLLACVSMLLHCTLSAKQPLAWSELDIAAISRMSPHQLELLAEGLAAEELIRAKRSGSLQSIAQIASKSSSGFSNKIGLLGQASAGASSFISSASSKGDEHGYHYDPPEAPKYDFWTLKKSILNTLFQAVKAITGGVTILKGQLIKGGGALASVAGKVISGKGEVVTNLGKKIVNSAQLSPPKKHHSSPPAHYGPPPVEYLPATAYGPPSAPSLHYGAPSAPSGPSKYTAHYEGRDKGQLNGLHAGLIFLKPLGQEAHDSGPPPDVHTVPSGPSVEHVALEPPQSIVSSAFQALKGVLGSVGPLSMFQTSSLATGPTAGPPSGHDYPPSPTHSTSFDTHESDHNDIFHPPPLPPPTAIAELPSFKPSTEEVLNSYGLPALHIDKPTAQFPSFPTSAYGPPLPAFEHDTDYGPTKLSLIPDSHYVTSKVSRSPPYQHSRLTPQKINKITENLKKLAALDRSSESMRLFDPIHLYQQMTHKKIEANRSSNLSEIISPRSFPEATSNFKPEVEYEVAKEEPKPNELLVNTNRTNRTHAKRSNKDVTDTNDTGKVAYILRGNRIVKIRLNKD